MLLQIHWFSIFNSFMMVIFLTGLVAMILLRTLRNDYAKYTRDDDDIESLEHDISEESGWKLVHGDVFRPPPNLALLAALLGTGVQLALLVLFVILITIAGSLVTTVSACAELLWPVVPDSFGLTNVQPFFVLVNNWCCMWCNQAVWASCQGCT